MHFESTMSAKLLLALPPVCLLIINNLIIPYSIMYVALCERNRQKSNEELRQLYINFYFLFLTSVALPFFGFNTMWQFAQMVKTWIQQQPIDSVAEAVGTKLLTTNGIFTLRYIVSAVFLSNTVALLKIPAYSLCTRWAIRLIAMSSREQADMKKPLGFAWGFWYAWVLIMAATGVIYGVVVPSLLPLMTLFFCYRHRVESYNMRNGLYDLGTDSEGTYAAAAVYHLVIVGVAWWCLMGVFFFTVCRQRDDCPGWLSPYGTFFLLVAPPLVVLPLSWLRKRHTFLGLSSERSDRQADEEEQVVGRSTALAWRASQAIEPDYLVTEVLDLLKEISKDSEYHQEVLDELDRGMSVEHIRNWLLKLKVQAVQLSRLQEAVPTESST